jgi:uncharacterized membrane protein
MNIATLAVLVHTHAPHSRTALYLTSALCAIASLAVVYGRCQFTRSTSHLTNGWLVRTAAGAAPIPIYCLLILAPFDHDLVTAMMEDQVVVAIAGLYGLVETLKDLRQTAGDARKRKNEHVVP